MNMNTTVVLAIIIFKYESSVFIIDVLSPPPLSLPPVCGSKLASGGYFMKQDDYYCSKDYHILFGTKCKTCGDFVEGRVVTALGHSYHPQCFTCNRCK